MREAALVTGGGVRLGRAIALYLAERGMDVALHHHRSREAVEATASEVRRLGVECEVFQADLGEASSVERLIPEVAEVFPGTRLLVNNASVYEPGTVRETTAALLDAQMSVNFRAPFLLTRDFARFMGRGHVINIIDTKIHFNQYPFAAYLLSKKALAELTRLSAVELGPAIRVNGVAPGMILPPPGRPASYLEARAEVTPLKMAGAPDYVLQAIGYLLDCPYVTGQILTVDGGEAEASVGMNVVSFGARAEDE